MSSSPKKQFLHALTLAATGSTSLDAFLTDVLTPVEYADLVFRWRILQDLHRGKSQRAIAADLGVSIAKITRGSHVLHKRSSAGARDILNLPPQPNTEKIHGSQTANRSHR